MGAKRSRCVFLLFIFIFPFPVPAQTLSGGLKFIENKNQWPGSIDFSARIPGGRLLVSPGRLSVYVFDPEKFNAHHHGHVDDEHVDEEVYDDDIRGHHVQLRFTGADVTSRPVGSLKTLEYYNFFLGSDSSRWASRAYAYGEVVYPSIWPGVDLKISSAGEYPKYDFIVKPEADPSQVSIEVSGAGRVSVENGNLVMQTSVGPLVGKKPFTYQFINGEKCEVKSEYRLADNNLSFYFPEGYDMCYELVIDPLLIFSTYSGSTADNWGSTATYGENGTLYSSGITNHFVGDTFSGTFPATPGAFQTTYGGNFDIAILKYDSTGSQLLYASYLGGSSNDSPHSLVMDERTQDLIVMGTSSSFNFPVTANAFSKTYNGGVYLQSSVFEFPNGSDIILARINSAGDKLLASTYLGGSHNDGINPAGSPLVRNYGDDLRGDVITDTLGNVYVTSVTQSTDFPAINSFSTTYKGGGSDAVVVKMDPMLSEIIWSAFIGGSGFDASHTLKFDSAYSIYIGGGTNSSNFPVTTGSYQTSLAGGADGWIARLPNNADSITAATFTGTSNFDQVYFLDLDNQGDVYAYGQTSGDFPFTPGVYRNANSGQFVQKFSGDLKDLIFSTVFGSGIGVPNISPTAFLVNECNNLYMSGSGGLINSELGYWSGSTHNMPVTSDALQKTTSGSDFYFIVLTADASELLYATYLGGNQSRTHVDGGTSRFDKSGIVYHAVCSGCRSFNPANGPTSDFPTTQGAWSRTNSSGNCNNAAFKFDLSSLRARLQTNSVAFDAPGLENVCFPDPMRFQNLSTGGEIYEWDLGDGTTLTKTDTNSFVHQYPGEGSYTVKLKAIDLNTCIGVDSVSRVIHVFNSEMKAQDSEAICFGTPYQLQASGGVAYSWRTDDGPLSSTTISPEKTTDYYVTITDQYGCVLEDTVKISVVPGIDLQMGYEFISDCFSRPAVLVHNKTISSSDETYIIDFGDGSTSDAPIVRHEYQQDNHYTLRLLGIKEFCVYEKQAVLPVYTLLVPNIITPEGTEGFNDRFTIQYGAKGRTPADAGLKVGIRIYSRWGNLVFESSDYQYDWAAKDVDAGVYFYSVTLDGHAMCKSWLQVIK